MQTIAGESVSCNFRRSPCFAKKIQCPSECPSTSFDPNHKVKPKTCYLDCLSPVCKAECKIPKPNCNGRGSACLDPRFVGADGIVFYFHGRSNEHFTLVSDQNLQINARFIGLRPEGRTRDYTWIQALGILFESHKFVVEATKATTWNGEIDHLKFSYNGEELQIPQGYHSKWEIEQKKISVERTSNKNSVVVNVQGVVEIYVNVVPVTKEDSRIHNYQIPNDDCFAHLEVQFKFYDLSSKVEGVLGRTYQPDFENPAKLGVAMPVVGGENKYRTTSLLSTDCGACLFAGSGEDFEKKNSIIEYGMMDCRSAANSGNGIVCKR
ncbi:Late embryogenesis abundant (LEA) protein [Trifolium repens]|nr:Late embryogenesis abundant (LEA) protein [Trifolium repens]